METGVSSMSLPSKTWINPVKLAQKPINALHFSHKYGYQPVYRVHSIRHLLAKNPKVYRPKVSRASENSSASLLEAGDFPAFVDESKTIKNKSEEIESYLHGRCIYLVGMMGCGKTTVGKVLAESLGYSFYDCDTLIEEAVGGSTVAEIFKSNGEKFFRDNETEVLHKLSAMHRLVVSTGGGAVVRPMNWRHMRKGVTVWLDVPLEALAQRITAVGTKSRPLLHHGAGDAYSKTMKRLSALFDERGDAYANSDVQVSLQSIAAKLGCVDACSLTPTAIAYEALLQLEKFLKK